MEIIKRICNKEINKTNKKIVNILEKQNKIDKKIRKAKKK